MSAPGAPDKFTLVAIWTLALAVTVGPMGCIAALILLNAAPELRQLLGDLLLARLPVAIIIGMLCVVVIAQLLTWLWREYPQRCLRLADALQLAASQVSIHQLKREGPPALLKLLDAVNALIRRVGDNEAETLARIQSARGVLVDERNWLAALMADLSVGVVVCNGDGCVLLYNKRARLQVKALQHAAHDLSQDALLGLGRSIFTLFERSEIEQQLQDIRCAAADPDQPVLPYRYLHARLASTLEGSSLRAHLSPVMGAAQDGVRDLNGFVLIMEHVSAAASLSAAASAALPLPGTPDPVASSIESRPEYYDFDLFSARDLSVGPDRPLRNLAFTAFDTETSGLQPSAGDEIIQVGAIRIVNGRLLRNETFDQLVNPGRRLKPDNIAIHGISNEQLLGKPGIDKVLPAFHAFCEGTVLVAHNAAFDMRFLEIKEAATGVRFSHPVLDTLLLSDLIAPQQESHRLEEIAARMGISVQGRHTALGDAIVTAQVFVAMIPLLEARGYTTLREVLDAARRSHFARLSY